VASVFFALGCAYAGPSIARAAVQPTVVTIQFDDGNADVYQLFSGLNNHGFPATFYVNSGASGRPAT
jgi:peptidoglycan/xylan/chitin deacetylase (PgdA/CDA1 family)